MSAPIRSSEPALELLRSPTERGGSYKGRPGYRLLALLDMEQREFWVVFIYSAGIGLLTLVGPVAIQVLVNIIAFESLLQPLVVLTLFLLVALGFATVLEAFRAYTVEVIQRRFLVRVATDFGVRLVRVKTDSFERFYGPELINRFFDVVTVQKSAAELLINGISLAMQTLVGMLLLAVYHPWLLAYDAVLLVVMAWVVFGAGRGAVSSAIQESEGKYSIAAWLEEIAGHVPVLKSASGVAYALGHLNALTKEYIARRKKHFRVVMRQIVSSLIVKTLSISLLLGLGGILVMRGQMTLGQLVAAEVVITMVVSAFAEFGKKLETYYDMLAALDKLGQVIDLPLERGGSRPPVLQDHPASVEMARLCLGPSGGEQGLDDVSLRIEPGERIAICGPRCAGKSTLARVLAGIRQPETGVLLVDGLDTKDLAPVAYREIAALAKGPDTFIDTVERNVSLDRPNVGIERVHEALDRMQLLRAVLSLPEGLQTMLKNGGPLTRAQAERVVLARAIAGAPRLLILDSILDRIDERNVFKAVCDALFAPDVPWTLVCITNRPDVISRCDRSFVVRQGSLEEIPISDAEVRAQRYQGADSHLM